MNTRQYFVIGVIIGLVAALSFFTGQRIQEISNEPLHGIKMDNPFFVYEPKELTQTEVLLIVVALNIVACGIIYAYHKYKTR